MIKFKEINPPEASSDEVGSESSEHYTNILTSVKHHLVEPDAHLCSRQCFLPL